MNTEWETPQDFFDNINTEFGFELDVCATGETAKVFKYFDKEDDGLNQEWYGTCWMNPPYDRNIYKWVHKAYHESRLGITVVCLLPAKTDTKWWHEFVMVSNEIRFVADRIHFGLDGEFKRANHASCLVIFKNGWYGNPKISTITNKGILA